MTSLMIYFIRLPSFMNPYKNTCQRQYTILKNVLLNTDQKPNLNTLRKISTGTITNHSRFIHYHG